MGDTTISGLAAGAPAALTDVLPVARAGSNKKLTLQDILAAFLPLADRRNMLVNGAFDVLQRANTYALTNAATYWIDRWFFYQTGVAQCTVSQVAPPVALPGFKNCLKLLLTGASTGVINVGQVVETIDVTKWQGRTVQLYIRALRGSTWNPANIAMKVITGTGTDEGSASMVAGTWTGQATTLNTTGNPAAANTWATLPSASFVVPVGCTELAVVLQATPSGAAVDANSYLCVAGVEVKETSVAADNYTFMPYAQEELLCQRWLPTYSAKQGSGGPLQGFATTATNLNPMISFKVPARVPPTGIVISAAGDFSLYAFRTAAAGAVTAIAFNSASVEGALVTTTTVAGTPTLAAGDGGLFQRANVNARIFFTGAEL